jgi:hypothetical protein
MDLIINNSFLNYLELLELNGLYLGRTIDLTV